MLYYFIIRHSLISKFTRFSCLLHKWIINNKRKKYPRSELGLGEKVNVCRNTIMAKRQMFENKKENSTMCSCYALYVGQNEAYLQESHTKYPFPGQSVALMISHSSRLQIHFSPGYESTFDRIRTIFRIVRQNISLHLMLIDFMFVDLCDKDPSHKYSKERLFSSNNFSQNAKSVNFVFEYSKKHEWMMSMFQELSSIFHDLNFFT